MRGGEGRRLTEYLIGKITEFRRLSSASFSEVKSRNVNRNRPRWSSLGSLIATTSARFSEELSPPPLQGSARDPLHPPARSDPTNEQARRRLAAVPSTPSPRSTPRVLGRCGHPQICLYDILLFPQLPLVHSSTPSQCWRRPVELVLVWFNGEIGDCSLKTVR